MENKDQVLIFWGVVVFLVVWCVLALRKKDEGVEDGKNSLFELLSVPGSVFFLLPVINGFTSIGNYPAYISIWFTLLSLFLVSLIYYPIYQTVNNSKVMINKIICLIFLILQLIYYILITIDYVNTPIVLDRELYMLFQFLSFLIPAYVVTISQMIHIFFPHRLFIFQFDNPKFLKAMIYSFTLNLINSFFIVRGFIGTSEVIVSIFSSIFDEGSYNALRICSYAIPYIMLIINFCTQYVTYKMRAKDEPMTSENILQEKLAYLQFSGYYVGFSYLSYSFNCSFIFAFYIICLIIINLDIAMSIFVFGFVLTLAVPYIVVFIMRKLYQIRYGYILYGNNFKFFKQLQNVEAMNHSINPFWLYFTFFISISFGVYGFINRCIILPLFRLIFAPIYPRPNSRGVLDIGYRVANDEKVLLELA